VQKDIYKTNNLHSIVSAGGDMKKLTQEEKDVVNNYINNYVSGDKVKYTQEQSEVLYNKIWKTLSTKLRDGVDCDYMADQIMDIVTYDKTEHTLLYRVAIAIKDSGSSMLDTQSKAAILEVAEWIKDQYGGLDWVGKALEKEANGKFQ
jgi:hypothetical protein